VVVRRWRSRVVVRRRRSLHENRLDVHWSRRRRVGSVMAVVVSIGGRSSEAAGGAAGSAQAACEIARAAAADVALVRRPTHRDDGVVWIERKVWWGLSRSRPACRRWKVFENKQAESDLPTVNHEPITLTDTLGFWRSKTHRHLQTVLMQAKRHLAPKCAVASMLQGCECLESVGCIACNLDRHLRLPVYRDKTTVQMTSSSNL